MTASFPTDQPNVFYTDGNGVTLILTSNDPPVGTVSPRAKAIAIALMELALQRAKALDDGSFDE